MKTEQGWGAFLGMFLAASIVLTGCTQKHSTSTGEDDAKTSPGNVPHVARQLDGGTYCVQAFTQGSAPSGALHFSNKVTESDGSFKDFESDFFGDSFDLTMDERHIATDMDRELSKVPGGVPITFHDGFAETNRTSHFTRSDASGWRVGPNSVALSITPWGLFISKPEVKEVGSENILGYDTIKYSVDTSHQSQLDKSPLLVAGKLSDYSITGTVWETKATNCVLQYSMDSEMQGKDGKVTKTHYEGTVAKK